MAATKVILLAISTLALLLSSANAQDIFLSNSFQATIAQKPFGMEVQAKQFPRVNAVLPGSPAEAAGVKAGFVLLAVGDQHVDAQDWFAAMQKAPVGTVLTFDRTDKKAVAEGVADAALVVPEDLDAGFVDFRCAVKSQSFGMEVSESQNGHPTVQDVKAGSPAEVAGVKVGDVLVGVAGEKVAFSTWSKAFQKAALPFALRFRRHWAVNVRNAKGMTGNTN